MENAGSGDIALPAGESPAADADARAAQKSLAAAAKERALLLLIGALAIGLAFLWLQFSTPSICCGDYDSYYHFRWSRMLWESFRTGHFPPRFDALPLTTLNPKDYVDHHFLFHILQIPFTWFGDFRLGAKVGTWLFACAGLFSCYWLIVRYRLSYPLTWLVALLGSSAPFLYRIHMGKAMSVSIVLLVAGIYLLFERKYIWLLPLAFLFALTYDMVFLLWVAAGIWVLVTLWVEQSFGSREFRRAIVGVGLVIAGTALGFIINPYFPHNLQLLYEHLIIKITPSDFTTPVGGEWYPYNTWEFLGNCGVATAAMLAGYLAFRDSTKKESQRALFFLVFATFLMLVNARWRRFSEYWPPFAIVFAAFALQPLIERARAATAAAAASGTTEAGADNADAEEPQGSRVAGSQAIERAERSRTLELALVGLVTVLLAAPMGWYHYITSKDIAGMPGPDLYRGGMEWVSKNVPRDEPLYNADWDDFPKLFFYDPHRPYVAGLDPTYLLDQNPELMKHYAEIGTGKEENPGPIIREKFCVGEGDARRCARYAFLDHEHEAFYNNALDSGWFDEVYADDDCIILRVRDAKGLPPDDNPPAVNQQGANNAGGDGAGDEAGDDEGAKDEEDEKQGGNQSP